MKGPITYKNPTPDTFKGLFSVALGNKKDPRHWIDYEGTKIWLGYHPTIESTKTFKLSLLSFNKKLAIKTKQELFLRGIYDATILPLERHKSVVEVDRSGIFELRINKNLLENPFSFEYTPSRHAKSGLTLMNQWHISPFTITNSFDPGVTVVHALNNYGVLIEDETPTSKILRFNSGAKPLDAPITFDDIVVRLEEIN